MTKEDTGVPVILRLEEKDGEWWEKEGNVKPLKKEPMGKDFEMPSNYWKPREKTRSLQE